MACRALKASGLKCPDISIDRKDKKAPLNYGRVVALGDFYRSATEAFEEKRDLRGLERAFKCIDKQGRVHARQETHPDTKYPDCTWVNIFSGTRYLEVLSTNIEHFGWYNIIEYIKIHTQALQLATRGYLLKKQQRDTAADYFLNKALFFNAYADHFLTDAFSAGHVRVPRKQVKSWAKKNLSGVLKSFIGDSLGNIMHDFDGRNRDGRHVGLKVKNALGHEWVTHCDNHLHSGVKPDQPVIMMPTRAVSLSVQEILNAFYHGSSPHGVFAALNLVPFVNDEPLAQKFKLGDNHKENARWIKKLRDGLDFPLRIITSKKNIKKMVQSLDDIMGAMAQDVRADLAEKDEIFKRMPEAYKQSFSNIE